MSCAGQYLNVCLVRVLGDVRGFSRSAGEPKTNLTTCQCTADIDPKSQTLVRPVEEPATVHQGRSLWISTPNHSEIEVGVTRNSASVLAPSTG